MLKEGNDTKDREIFSTKIKLYHLLLIKANKDLTNTEYYLSMDDEIQDFISAKLKEEKRKKKKGKRKKEVRNA